MRNDESTTYAREGLEKKKMHLQEIEPKILYFGTPVALISTLNPDSSTNLAPI